MEKLVKTRKSHTCNQCSRIILAGEVAILREGKCPTYDNEDKQVGVWFWREYICQYKLHNMEEMERQYGHFKNWKDI